MAQDTQADKARETENKTEVRTQRQKEGKEEKERNENVNHAKDVRNKRFYRQERQTHEDSHEEVILTVGIYVLTDKYEYIGIQTGG